MVESGQWQTTDALVRAYDPADEAALIRVWNAVLHADPIDAIWWRRRVLLDPNFVPDGCLVVEGQGEVRGFLLSLTRQVPFFGDGLQPEQGWITAFGIEPGWQGFGLGRALLERALDRLRRLGCRTVTVGPYLPNYVTPGIDVAAYGRAINFLLRHGFELVERPLDMQAGLVGLRVPNHAAEVVERLQREGIAVRAAAPSDIVPLLDLIRRHFSWNWHRAAREVLAALAAGDPRGVGMQLAVQRETNGVLGYAQHAGEFFGPLGVRPDMRGRGIATALLMATLADMRKQGRRAVYVHWTFDEAARLYSWFGFEAVRRFAILRRAL